ncbi:hypothetical protein CT0861_10768 [Colletotrichum tofieldiae]|uniref:Uncharacterized protein n=1 Tax=Colletotrichum tofieldiae TaxID=708197 RepID=A0A166WMU6_9PEZI|nr:hypothetical protein CT0861_10768 [Colletotrichum tofieldiae]
MTKGAGGLLRDSSRNAKRAEAVRSIFFILFKTSSRIIECKRNSWQFVFASLFVIRVSSQVKASGTVPAPWNQEGICNMTWAPGRRPAGQTSAHATQSGGCLWRSGAGKEAGKLATSAIEPQPCDMALLGFSQELGVFANKTCDVPCIESFRSSPELLAGPLTVHHLRARRMSPPPPPPPP